MRIYIASSYRNLHVVQMLTAVLTEQGHVIEDRTKLAPPLSAELLPEEAKAWLDSDERGEIFDFCSAAFTDVDLLIYVGPAGQDAACEVGLAAASGIPVFGLSGPLERPGLILSGLIEKWFSSAAELLWAINDGSTKARLKLVSFLAHDRFLNGKEEIALLIGEKEIAPDE